MVNSRFLKNLSLTGGGYWSSLSLLSLLSSSICIGSSFPPSSLLSDCGLLKVFIYSGSSCSSSFFGDFFRSLFFFDTGVDGDEY